MNIQKFLAATSILAMTATSANALDIRNSGINFSTPLALELCLDDPGAPTIPGTVAFNVQLTSQGNFPQDQLITVNLPPNVVFDGAVQGSDVQSNSSVNTQASVQSGGADGGSTVQFVLSEAGTPATQVDFALAVEVSGGCPDGSGVDVIMIDSQTGLFVEGDAVVNTNEAITSGPGVTPRVAEMNLLFPTCAPATSTTIVADAPFKEIALSNTPGVPDYVSISNSDLGTITHTINPVAVNAIGTLVSAADITNVTTRVTVEDPTGLQAASHSGGTDTFGTGTVAAFLSTFTTVPTDVFVTSAAGNTPIQNQPVSVETRINFTAGSGLEAKDFVSGGLDPLNREGATFGTFDWVGSTNGGGKNTVLRVTGLPTATATPYNVTLTNTPNGAFDGVYEGTVPAGNDGEIALQSFNLFGVDNPVAYVRGDAEICFETGDTSIDVDRLLARNGNITAFNDGANNNIIFARSGTPEVDFDNGNGNE